MRRSPGCPLGTRSAGNCWWCGFPSPAEAEAAVIEGVGLVGRIPAGHHDSWVGRTGKGVGFKLVLPNMLCDFGLATPWWASASSSNKG